MKKNLIYLAILLVLAVVAYFALNKKKRLYPIEEANFTVENVSEVTKIFLSDPKIGNIQLTKRDHGVWWVNDTFRARQDWVAFLLEALEKQEPNQMIPKSMHNNIIKQLASNSIKVEIFKGDKKTNQFYVSKQPSRDNLTVMLNIKDDGTNASRPFLVKEGYSSTFLGVRYRTPIEDWIDKQIMYFDAHEIKDISVSYTAKPSASYTLQVSPSLRIDPATTDSSSSGFNLERAQKYVSFYDKMFCMGYENNYARKDTFLKTFSPFAEVVISSTNNQKEVLKIYYRPREKGTDNVLTIDGIEFDGDAFFGLLNDKDFILISRPTVEKMLREHWEFFTKDVAPATNTE